MKILIIFIIATSLLLFYYKNNETFVVSEKDEKMLSDLIEYIDKNTEYIDYIQWLNARQNTLLILIEIEFFNQIKNLKKNNKLNLTSLKNFMKEYTE